LQLSKSSIYSTKPPDIKFRTITLALLFSTKRRKNTFIHTPIAAHSVVVVLNMSNSNDIHVIKLYALKL
ncbi:hypothetical protein K4G15_004860, partial [Enterobacter hormaechei]